jgi:hypothetical protein
MTNSVNPTFDICCSHTVSRQRFGSLRKYFVRLRGIEAAYFMHATEQMRGLFVEIREA